LLSPEKKRLEDDWKKVSHYFTAYRLKADILGDPKPKQNNQQFVAHKKGTVYYQNELGTETLMFKYNIGDPEYFERVPELDYKKEDSVYKLQVNG